MEVQGLVQVQAAVIATAIAGGRMRNLLGRMQGECGLLEWQ